MKRLILIFTALTIFSCSKEEEKLQIYSEEAFAFYLESSWELNASARIKGFTQQEDEEDFYIAKLSYSINLVTPASDTLANIDYGLIDERNPEEMIDIELDTQIEIDTAFAVGKYKIIFIVDDNLSQRTASSEKEFELSKE